ncbi:PREDICTED: uncharacterized protein LOC108353918, partial [Rhagoletis zephyria]|uniref:uncharacterized protein LOC108353918 n=1 Tax=Rhagoletis zephyria TaxID=28612 RepID=UPI000811A49F
MASTAAAATTNGHSGTINGKLHTSETNGPESDPDLVMMTTLKKELAHTILRVERVDPKDSASLGPDDHNGRHVAGGQHQGIIINKQLGSSVSALNSRAFDLRLAFKVYLINAITSIHQQESRELRFWFSTEDEVLEEYGYSDRMHCAQAFFRALVGGGSDGFPKSYVAFIMKLMKTMQSAEFRPLRQLELEVRAVDEPFERPPSSAANSRPCSVDENSIAQLIPLTEEKVLEMIEAAYPNPISLVDIANSTRSAPEEVHHLLLNLTSKGVARFTDPNSMDQVVRVTSDETKVKRVRQMPEVVRSQAPTVAIITAQFCEKLAVDAMIENKDTYVRYKVEGESNVYTLGNIGQHRVVATKLPAVGNSRSAMIAAGNTTTRLLGTFQHVEYVFLVGIGGGVPHYTDFRQHVRLGDVVVSTSPKKTVPPASPRANGHSQGTNGNYPNFPAGNMQNRSDYVYVHCEKLRSSPDEPLNASNSAVAKLNTVDSFNYRFWCPYSLELQDIAKKLLEEAQETGSRPWEQYLVEAREKLMESDDLDFVRPDPATDKLFMSIGTNDLIEMAHPEAKPEDNSFEGEEYDPRKAGFPAIHFGAIGSGRLAVGGNEQLRQDIAQKWGLKAFDIEYDTVIESIFGNRKDR